MNNNHQNKSKRIQCKDISTLALLQFIAHWTDQRSSVTSYRLDDPRSIWSIVIPVIPMCVMRQKLENMTRKGLTSGCYCGCRGDFTITDKGRAQIPMMKDVHLKLLNVLLSDFIYEYARRGDRVNRSYLAGFGRNLNHLIDKGQLTAIDAVLQHIDFGRVNNRMGIALLQSTSRVRNHLAHWQSALTRFDQLMAVSYPRHRKSLMAWELAPLTWGPSKLSADHLSVVACRRAQQELGDL